MIIDASTSIFPSLPPPSFSNHFFPPLPLPLPLPSYLLLPLFSSSSSSFILQPLLSYFFPFPFHYSPSSSTPPPPPSDPGHLQRLPHQTLRPSGLPHVMQVSRSRKQLQPDQGKLQSFRKVHNLRLRGPLLLHLADQPRRTSPVSLFARAQG